MELIIPLDNHSGIPMYEQIYQYMKKEIRQGHLGAGSRLPSTRVLASHLKISRSTTQMAYDQLLSEGYIESSPCRGYFVSEMEELIDIQREERQKHPGVFVEQEEEKEAGYAVDFSPRGIDLDSFPFNTWRKITKNILVNDNKALFLSGDPQGEYALRDAIRAYLHTARGVRCQPDQIIIGAGTEYLLMLLSMILGRNRVIAMENPTYRQAYHVFVSQGQPVIPISMDKSGMSVELLREQKIPEPDTAYVMPANQYPMGIVMPVKRRQELLAWAKEKEGRYIIEDDYDSEFRYKGKPIPALQGMDEGEKVIYIGTFSKSIAQAIRVGFMVLPKRLLEEYQMRAGFFSSTVPRIDQNILYQFLTEGYYERHLNRMRGIYKGKHDCFLEELKGFEDKFMVGAEYAGLHLLLSDTSGRKEQELLDRAAAAGVKAYGLSQYFIYPEYHRYPSTIVLGYANLSEKEIGEGVKRLREAWDVQISFDRT